jgi:uncharacterized protein YjiK
MLVEKPVLWNNLWFAVYITCFFVRNAYDLLHPILPQPEGICFDEKSDMYVSTKARNGKPAYIYKFTMKNKQAS